MKSNAPNDSPPESSGGVSLEDVEMSDRLGRVFLSDDASMASTERETYEDHEWFHSVPESMRKVLWVRTPCARPGAELLTLHRTPSS